MNIDLSISAQSKLESIIAEVFTEQAGFDRLTQPDINIQPKINKNIAKRIATDIYDSKGVFKDDINKLTAAIKKIQDANEFNLVQKELKKLTGGRGIGQYIASFLRTDIGGLDINIEQTLKYGRKIVNHLKQIKANPQTIDIINDKIAQSAVQQSMSSATSGTVGGDAVNSLNDANQWISKHDTWDSFINAPGGLRSMVYSPIGIGVTTTAALIPTPWTKIPVAILFGVLAIDDIRRISNGDEWAKLDLLFDGIGIFTGGGGLKVLKPIGQKIISLMKWVKTGGVLARISRGLFNVLFEIISAISKTSFGRVLANGAKAVTAMQSAIRTGIAKSLSFIKKILTQLKNSMPNPVKRWAANTLNALKSTSVNYYMEELKPLFDTMRMIANGVREFIRAPKITVLALAEKLGITSEWVVPVSYGAQAAWVAHLFTAIPDSIVWWKNWYDTQMSEAQKQQWIKDIKYNTKQYMQKEGATFYTFKKRPGTMITLYSYNPGYDPEWEVIVKKPIQIDSNTNGPLVFIGDKKMSNYVHITLPANMTASGEINDAWIKISDIVKIPLKDIY